jgi:predicted AAA+ superfamily ATPase
MIIKRKVEILLKSRISEDFPLIQVIIGPRQVGKTTAIRSVLSNFQGVFYSADSPTPIPSAEIELWWKEALNSKDKILAIDEIQKIPGWAEAVKKLWDEPKQKIKLILSGSAALAIEKNLKESLAGRFELIRASHWTFSEFQSSFSGDLLEYLEFGCYPGAHRFIDDIDRWGEYIRDSIVEPAIGRDILQLHPVENPALFRQVFLLCTQLPAQVVSINKLLGKLQDRGAIATIQHYLNLLTAAFLISSVQKYSESGFRTKSSSPKIIVQDNALLKAFERPIGKTIENPKLGHYFENSIGARFIEAGWDTYYWKDRDLEVDFIVDGPEGEKWAIEVKSSEVKSSELNGLDMFCKRHPEYQPCLISLVGQTLPGFKELDPKSILSLVR